VSGNGKGRCKGHAGGDGWGKETAARADKPLGRLVVASLQRESTRSVKRSATVVAVIACSYNGSGLAGKAAERHVHDHLEH
jgi:hypothetical protein